MNPNQNVVKLIRKLFQLTVVPLELSAGDRGLSSFLTAGGRLENIS